MSGTGTDEESDPDDDGSSPPNGNSNSNSNSEGNGDGDADDGADPGSAPDADPSGGDDGDAGDTGAGDDDDDGTGVNPREGAYIAAHHIGGVAPMPRPPREMPLVARHAGISSKKPHNIDAVSHAGQLAPAPPGGGMATSANPAKQALDAAIGDLPSAQPSASQSCPEQHWIEIVLVDQENVPVPDVAYRIVGPDGQVHTGALDRNGFARVDGLPAGNCQVGFPDLEDAVWQRQGGAAHPGIAG